MEFWNSLVTKILDALEAIIRFFDTVFSSAEE